MRILAISGSLRAQSTNTALLRAMGLLGRTEFDVVVYEELGEVPGFNPDLDEASGLPAVLRFRQLVRGADAVLISTPEYAHGVPGSLKNALDWIVGSGELSGKPVALVNASARGVFARAALKEIVQTMDARLVAEAEVTVPLLGRSLSPQEIVSTPEMAAALNASLDALAGFLADSA